MVSAKEEPDAELTPEKVSVPTDATGYGAGSATAGAGPAIETECNCYASGRIKVRNAGIPITRDCVVAAQPLELVEGAVVSYVIDSRIKKAHSAKVGCYICVSKYGALHALD